MELESIITVTSSIRDTAIPNDFCLDLVAANSRYRHWFDRDIVGNLRIFDVSARGHNQ